MKSERRMTRKQCEKKIWELLKEIKRVYRMYHPEGEHLNMCIIGNYMTANNVHWEKRDSKRPIQFSDFGDGKGIVEI